MMLEHEMQGGALVVRPLGRLDGASSPALERLLAEHFEIGVRRLVLDMSDMDYVSSAGLKVILLAGRQLRGDGKLALAGVRDMVQDVFEVTGLTAVLPLAPTIPEAVAKVQ